MIDYDDDDEALTPRSREEWALLVAISIQKEHGANGPLFIAEMLGKFALDGDVKRIRHYQEIAKAYEALLIPKSTKH